MLDVSIILVNYNTCDLTLNCIKSIYEKTKDVSFEIIVVDNNSSDNSCEKIMECYPEIILIKNKENKGFGAANNIAIKISNAKYIFCLNTDTVLINNSIKIMFDFMEKNTNVGACGGTLLKEDLTLGNSYAPFPSILNSLSISWILKQIKKKFKKKEEIFIKEVDMICGADIFLRKALLDDIGVFDEIFFMYYEEADLCYRIKKNGYKIKYLPTAKIIHYGEKSSKSSWSTIKQRVKSKYIYGRKNCSPYFIYFVKISYLILHLICYLFTFDSHHKEMFFVHLNEY